MGTAAEAAAASYSGTAEVPGCAPGALVTVGVSRADGRKCERCWNYSTLVGRDGAHPALCERCVPVVVGMGMAAATVAAARAPAAA